MVQLDGPNSMVFIENKNNKNNKFTKPLHHLLPAQVQTECEPRGMIMHQKINVLIFLIYAQKGQLKKSTLTILVSSFVFIFFPQKKIPLQV
jgi:hypothetical protein